MARNRISMTGDLFADYMAKLDKLGGTTAMKSGVDKALKESKNYVNPLITKAMAKGNLPAHGKYSKGTTLKSLDTDNNIKWSAFVAETKVGFKFEKSGLKSIFLMYGTPRMKPVKGLKSAIYGSKTQKELQRIQGEVLNAEIQKIMGGN